MPGVAVSDRGPRRAEEGQMLTGEDTGLMDIMSALGEGSEAWRFLTQKTREGQKTTPRRRNET